MAVSNWIHNRVVASSEDAYYKCFDAATPTDPDPNTSYEKWYRPFEKRIAGVLGSHKVPAKAASYFDSWCANRTRHVTVERRYLTPDVVRSLHALLADDYAYWRIDVIVVGEIDADDRVGQLGIWHDWVLTWGCGEELIPQS